MKLKAGEKAPAFIATDILGNTINLSEIHNEKIFLSFFRYAECAMCNLQIAKIIKSKELLEANDIKLIAIFESPAESLKTSIADRHQFNFTIIADTKRELYNLYRVKPSWLKTLQTMTVKGFQHLYQAKKLGFKIGGKVEGSFNQIPADFLISKNGIIQIAHYGNSVIDHYPLKNILGS
jgi:thioredoxin-dependent peroxiredoxin